MKTSRYLPLVILLILPIFVSAQEGATCDEFTAPFTSVADFDGNGVVNRRDIAMLAKVIRKNKRIERRNRTIERYNSRRSRHHRGEERSNSRRLKELKQIVYSPLFDRNGDGDVDIIDMFKATRDMGKSSSQTDQKLVTAYNDFMKGTYSCAETTEVEVEVEVKVEPEDARPS